MREFLQTRVLDNPLQDYFAVIAAIIFAFALKRFISRYLAGLLFRLFARAGRRFHKEFFLDLVVEPLEWFLIALLVVISLDRLKMPQVLDFSVHHVASRDLFDAFANGSMVIIFIWLCIRLVEFFGLVLSESADENHPGHNQLVIFFKDFFKVILVIIGGILLLSFSFHYHVSNLVTGLSLVGAAIALATRESLENLIASFIIFFDKPFFVGDNVRVNGFTGNIEKIGLRSTRIRTDQKTYITVPNKQMVDSIVDNITLRSLRKAEVRLELGLDAPPEKLEELITGIRKLMQRPEIASSNVFFAETGKNAHVVTADFFAYMTQSLEEFNATRQEMNMAILRLMKELDITFAAAATDIVIRQQVERRDGATA